MLSQVLTEKAQKKATDPVLQENLRSASQAGVKIAAAKEYIKKVAADESHPGHAALMESLAKKKGKKKDEKESGEEKKSNAMLGGGSGGVSPSSTSGSPTPNPM
jgi:hypothetical protein